MAKCRRSTSMLLPLNLFGWSMDSANKFWNDLSDLCESKFLSTGEEIQRCWHWIRRRSQSWDNMAKHWGLHSERYLCLDISTSGQLLLLLGGINTLHPMLLLGTNIWSQLPGAKFEAFFWNCANNKILHPNFALPKVLKFVAKKRCHPKI